MKRTCESLANDLHNIRFECDAIHGDKCQEERERTLRNFRSGKNLIMIATDVAARGIDVPNIKAVINYDFP